MRVRMSRRVVEGTRSRWTSLARSNKLRAPRQRAIQRLEVKRLQDALNNILRTRDLTDEMVRANPSHALARVALENLAQYMSAELPHLLGELEAWVKDTEAPTQLPSHPLGRFLIHFVPMHPCPQTVQDLRGATKPATLWRDCIEPITKQLIDEIEALKAIKEPLHWLKVERDLIARGYPERSVQWTIEMHFLSRGRGAPPQGWMLNEEKELVPDLAVRRAIWRILVLSREGRGHSEIEKILAKEEIRDRKGSFTAGRIRKIIGRFN